MESTSEVTVLESIEGSVIGWHARCPQPNCNAPLLLSMSQYQLQDWKDSFACWRCGTRYEVQLSAGQCKMRAANATNGPSSNGAARDASPLSPSGEGILIKAIEEATEPLLNQIRAVKKQLDALSAALDGDRKNRPPELSAAAPGPAMASPTRLEVDLADMAEAVTRIEKAIKATAAKGEADVQSRSDLLREIIAVQDKLERANLRPSLKVLDEVTSGTSKDVKALKSRLRGSDDKPLIAEIKLMVAEYFQDIQIQGKRQPGVLSRLARIERALNAVTAGANAAPVQPEANAEANGQSPDESPPIALAPATVKALVAQLAAHRFAELNGQREKIPEDVPALIDKVELQLHSWRHAERPELPKEAREAVVAVLEDVVDSIGYWLEAHGINRYGKENDPCDYALHNLHSTAPTTNPELVDKVKEVVFSGYRWQESGKVLRAAKVIAWSKAPSARPAEPVPAESQAPDA